MHSQPEVVHSQGVTPVDGVPLLFYPDLTNEYWLKTNYYDSGWTELMDWTVGELHKAGHGPEALDGVVADGRRVQELILGATGQARPPPWPPEPLALSPLTLAAGAARRRARRRAGRRRGRGGGR